ncbi:hypothetical protein JCM8202v2_003688 [Rhodotorula sphaerocarpa]
MAEMSHVAQPVASTSQAAAEPEASPPPPAEQEQFSMADLFTADDIVDSLVTAVEKEDVAACVSHLSQLRLRQQEKLVNQPHSSTDQTALIAVATKESTRTREVLVRMLAHSGATLPPVDDKAQWLADVQSWAIKLIEEPRAEGSERELEIRTLLDRDYDSAREWCAEHLPPPVPSEEDLEDFGGYTSDDLGALPNGVRSSSVPVDDAVMRYQRSHRAATADVLQNPAGPAPAADDGADALPSRAAKAPRLRQPGGQSSGTLEVIDLTEDRTPSPMVKDEEAEAAVPAGNRATPNGRKRPRSRSPPANYVRATPMPEARAHLHVSNLPDDFTNADLAEVFAGVSGVCDVEVHQSEAAGGAPFGFVSLVSLVAAQHAFVLRNNTLPRPTADRRMGLKIYSADGIPLDPHRPVEPIVNGSHAAAPEMPPPPPPPFRTYGGPMAGGMPRRFPRPETPFHFTAAELARRVYIGCLRYGISNDEVVALFNDRAGVVARVLRVIHAQDGSHSFGFVQLPDSVTARHAQTTLHGTQYGKSPSIFCKDHLLQVEPVNELNHRWRWSMTLHGLPPRWGYRDVSDFLISTIGSFAGLVVRQSDPYGAGSYDSPPYVRVEVRYETELIWAWNEIDGLTVGTRPISAVIDQPRVRAQVERERRYQQIERVIMQGQRQEARRERMSATPMSDVQGSVGGAAASCSTGGGCTPRNPSLLSSGGTPLAQRMPPPPPPPPVPVPVPIPVPEPAATAADVNPFAPNWL